MFVCIVILVVTFILFIVHIPFGSQHLLKRLMWLNKVGHHDELRCKFDICAT